MTGSARIAGLKQTRSWFTGTVELAELDGPFVKLRLQGRFWHKKADVLARVAVYLRRRIPDIIEIDIEDESQLDDSAANF